MYEICHISMFYIAIYFMKKKLYSLFLLGAVILFFTAACSKNSNSHTNIVTPSATSLIKAKFDSSFANGHFTQSTNSKELNQKSKLDGLFLDKGGLIKLNYTLVQKKRIQTEKMWLTSKNMYLLLEQNKGNWIKNSIATDNFDADQVKERFSPVSFKTINKIFASKAIVRKNKNNYEISFNGVNNNLWNALYPLVIDAMNTPGSQNMQIARLVKAAQVQNITVTYLVDSKTKNIESMSFKAKYTIGSKYNFAWNLNYDQMGQHGDLSVPVNVQNNAIDATKIKNS